eukprot:4433028-Prymnesium_polylepis.2
MGRGGCDGRSTHKRQSTRCADGSVRKRPQAQRATQGPRRGVRDHASPAWRAYSIHVTCECRGGGPLHTQGGGCRGSACASRQASP